MLFRSSRDLIDREGGGGGQDAPLLGRRAVWRPFIPQRTVLNEAVGERAPVHALGYRAKDTAEVFDALYRKLARVTTPA